MRVITGTARGRRLKELEGMEWKGNVRQVHNVVERLVVLAGNPITRDEVLDNVSNFY